MHNDARGRQSLALDLIEPLRPEAEGFVLDLLASRTFRKVEFTETADGHCRLLAPLTHELAETMPRWARLVAPVAEEVAHALGQAMAGKYKPATPLTGRRSRAAQAAVKARKVAAEGAARSKAVRQRPNGQGSVASWSCPDCGAAVTDRRRVRCDACIAADPSQTLTIRESRAKAISKRKRALREWDAAHPDGTYDPDYFAREVLPRLRKVKLADIMAVTGMSKSFASCVRSGKYTPHVSTWPALAKLAGAPVPVPTTAERSGAEIAGRVLHAAERDLARQVAPATKEKPAVELPKKARR